MISLEDDIAQSMERALIFAGFVDRLAAPTPAQLWLERAAGELERQRDPDGTGRARTDRLKIEIMERDGPDCWFCARPLNGDVTLEHLQPRALGGSWNPDNLALAHAGCNKAAGHLSRIKKEAMREDLQSRQLNPSAAQGASNMGDCAAEPRTALSSLRDGAGSRLHPPGFDRISQEEGEQ